MATEIEGLKARVAELVEALEDIHSLVHPPELIADSAYPILLRVLDIIENALEDDDDIED